MNNSGTRNLAEKNVARHPRRACVDSIVALQVSPLGVQPRGTLAARCSSITCGWGPDPVWTPNKVVSISDAAEGLVAVTIAPPPGVADSFTSGGQYVQIREVGAEKAGFFAIASSPTADGDFEFLIKDTPPSDWSPGTGWLTGASAGLELEMSQVLGGGFPVADKLDDSVEDVLLFAAGSGISPIRSVIESRVLDGRNVHLYYGARTPAHLAYADKFDAWSASGVKVTPVVSQPAGTDWDGATGYVQEAAKADGVPAGCGILMCGMKGMAEGVKALASESGVAEDRVLTNF
jgi:ferredoxin-NADP reductase